MPQPTLDELAAKLGTRRLPAAYLGDPALRSDAPSREPGQLARETYKERERRRLALGIHPTGIAPLATEKPAKGETCATCARCVLSPHGGNGTYYKCLLARPAWTQGRATDVLRRWPACERWIARSATGE